MEPQAFRKLIDRERGDNVVDMALQRHRAAVRARLLESGCVRPGAGSVTWKINREIVVVAGWGRAILLQLAHPSVAAAVHDHSYFRGGLLSAFRRQRSTVRAMLSITFADTEGMIEAAARINAIHDRVRSPSPTAGRISGGEPRRAYSAHDPELQRWVHATLLESILLTYELLVGPLTDSERDRYCVEAAIMEPLLGMPAGWLPRTAAQLDTYMRDMLDSGTIAVTDAGRALGRAVLHPRRWYFAWPVFRAIQVLTIGSLPPPIRQAYGCAWGARGARTFARWTTLMRTVRRMLPPLAREWPIARRRGSAPAESRMIPRIVTGDVCDTK